MEPKDRLIVALDNLTTVQECALAENLSEFVGGFKLGLEHQTRKQVFLDTILPRFIQIADSVERRAFADSSAELDLLTTAIRRSTHDVLAEAVAFRRLSELVRGRRFHDGKGHDIPETIKLTVRQTVQLHPAMFNVHCLGGEAMLRAAKEESVRAAAELGIASPIVLGVTILTSNDYPALVRMGLLPELNIHDEKERNEVMQGEMVRLVKTLALLAQDCGLDGVVCSAKEVGVILRNCGPDFIKVTPGIRPADATKPDDQKRVGTPRKAILDGATHIVVGRPVTQAQDQVEAAKRIVDEVAQTMKEVA